MYLNKQINVEFNIFHLCFLRKYKKDILEFGDHLKELFRWFVIFADRK